MYGNGYLAFSVSPHTSILPVLPFDLYLNLIALRMTS
jgi:hypothetical protein